ncbi:MAG: TonB-dependent receptor [Bacteroidales bacterium]|nr:TonB-dependent receptor [Bacteroidales bacterium]
MRKMYFLWLSLFLLFGYQAYSQERIVTGTVTELSTGLTLPGVTVVEKGTTNGTVTDVDGQYSLAVPANAEILVFSFIGMNTQEMKIPASRKLNIQMEGANIDLDEVVVIGYGAVKKSDLTGSVASLNMEKLSEIPANSFDKKMQGRIAGVQVTQLSGQPGGATSVRVRGGNSIMAGNEPLYVIDGVIMEGQQNFSWIGSPAENGLSSINPNDIESIEILKDASATAIYGARGANGVVIVTTKRGKKGKGIITFNAYAGIQQKTTNINVMNASQFGKLFDDAGLAADSNYKPLYLNPDSLGTGTDWQKEIYRDALIMNYSLNFSGGTESTTYSIGGDYFDQDGIIVGSDFKRYSFRLNIDQQVVKKLKVGANVAYNRTDANTVSTDTPGGFFPGVVNTALTFSPILPIYDSAGNYTLTDPNADAWLDNPVAVTRTVQAVSRINRLIGRAYIDYTIIPDLVFNTSLGIDFYNQNQDMYTPRTVFSGSFNDGQARYATTNLFTYIWENTLTYSKIFKTKHALNVMGGYTFQKSQGRTFIDIATKFPNDILGYYGIENAENIPTIYASFGESAMESMLGRINYTFDKRYLFTVTGRVDGSSRFGSNNKYAFFPSVAFAWRLSQEKFIKDLNTFSDLKLRISYGKSGNDRIANYSFIRTIASTSYYFNNGYLASGFAPDNPGNNNLKWETTDQVDAGIDVGFFDSRLTITADYYYKKTNDLLFFAELPWTTGYSSYIKNIGSLRNSGFELSLSSANFVNAFKWNTDFNISFNSNRVLDLNGEELFINNDTYKLKIGNWAVIREGEPLGSFWGLESDGIWQTADAAEASKYGAQPGDFKYVDQNGDGKINADDRKIIGHALPKFFWGFGNTFSFKNISLHIFFQGQHGNQILNSNRFELESGNGLSNASVNMVDRWTPDNPSNIYPRANRNADYLHMSDRYLEDGSYVRLKVITLSYNFPAKWMNAMKINGIKVYITAENLLTFTKYTGFDPEVSRYGQDNTRMGYDYGGYPASRSFIFGINFNI